MNRHWRHGPQADGRRRKKEPRKNLVWCKVHIAQGQGKGLAKLSSSVQVSTNGLVPETS